jgi:hydroxymethylglutaryl-CoA reductase (NADPH)
MSNVASAHLESLARGPVDGDSLDCDPTSPYRTSIERFAGTVRVPVGYVGPVTVHGRFAEGQFRVPLATTEGALVASYHRGCRALNDAGGARAIVTDRAMTRTPCFRFPGAVDAYEALATWREHLKLFQSLTRTTSAHCELRSLDGVVEGNHLYVELEFTTGEAAGQNMVTLAAEALCRHAVTMCPVPPVAVYLEANLSGDKKASAKALSGVRGHRVVAEIEVPAAACLKHFKSSPGEIEDHWYASAMGGTLSGSVGLQGHYANALAAIYIALGQDAACAAESAVGITRMQAGGTSLYAAVTLPSIIVGTVGGGSALPEQRSFLESLHLPTSAPTAALAEIIAAVCLAGELSLAAAITRGSFARAHRVLGRRRHTHA